MMRRSAILPVLWMLGSTTTVAACAPPIAPLAPTPTPAPTPVLSAAAPSPALPVPVPPLAAPSSPSSSSPITVETIHATADSLLQQPLFRTATWSILVVGPRGDTIYAHDPARLVVPASNMKLVTVASALITLGPDYRFRANAVALPLRDTVPSDFGPMYDTLWLRNRPLRDVAAKVLKPSQNRLAEQLFYTMALERTGVASRDSAAAVVRRQLAAWALPADGYLVADGSGYNRANYLSAETIVGILQRMRSSPLSALWYDALPIAGVDGTLVRRMRATRAEGNAHAKTGSLGAVRSLAGYVTTAQGEELTFAFLCNGFTVPSDSVTGVMDRMVAMLADLSTSPAPIP